MTLASPDLLEQLGLDDFVRCDAEECAIRATWWLICAACNHHTALCALHRLELDKIAPIKVRRGGFLGRRRYVYAAFVVCDQCRAKAPATIWRTLFYLVPIGDA